MNFQQLEYIIALDQFKSFSKAAETCFITQATLSTMVKKLEVELNVVIFDRKTNPIITTDCGIEIIEEAKKIIFHKNYLQDLAPQLKGKIEGEINLGIIPTVANSLLHRVLPKILEKYPRLKITISEITTQNIVDKLKTAEIDVGVVSTPLNYAEIEEEILYYEKLLVYGNTLNGSKFRSPRDIDGENLWLLQQGNCITDQILNVCSLSSKTVNRNLNFQPNSFETLLNLVDEFNGLTLIPELHYIDLSPIRKEKISDFNSPFPVREISLIYHRPYAKHRIIMALSEEIKAIIKPLLKTSYLKNKEMLIAKI
ncbi:MAG: LysR family transcriptional regulator [Sphingobacteriales bacterium]|nr:LysR family transcriptional regulator [Sphingobacteriales bacterium]